MQAHINGLRIEYNLEGPVDGPTVVLVAGLGQQLVSFHPTLVQKLTSQGFRVLRFDHRDAGLSSKVKWQTNGGLAWAYFCSYMGWRVSAPYTLYDLESDMVSLLDVLSIAKVHLVGVSMGGMIAQIMAVKHPERVLSLTSVMSSAGERDPTSAPLKIFRSFFAKRPARGNIDEMMTFGIAHKRALAGPEYPTSDEELEAAVRRSIERMWYPAGIRHQMLAVLATKDRSKALSKINIPTLVIHGDADPVVPVEQAHKLSALIPHAELNIVRGLGHDLPPSFCPKLAMWITQHAHKVEHVKN